MKIISDFKTTRWSKGTTTELYAFPEDSSLENRDFDFRISIATVESDSTFTPFEGFHRILTLMEGALNLNIDSKTTSLLPYDQISFDGGSEVFSTGQSQNFNVIAKKEFNCQVKVLQLKANQTIELNFSSSLVCIYLASGHLKIDDNEITAGQLLVLNNETYQKGLGFSDSRIFISSFDEDE